jgi:rare lipoprotein A
MTGETFASGNQCGGASWYSLPGQRTASGARMNPHAMTAAHKSLPLGSVVRVVNQRTGKTIRVTINDRGPYIRGRIIDLSKAAAQQLGIIAAGTGKVCLTTA